MHSHKLDINVFMPLKSYIFTIIKKKYGQTIIRFELKANEKNYHFILIEMI